MSPDCLSAWCPSANEIRQVFEEEAAALGGELVAPFESGDALFLRMRLPRAAGEVQTSDRVEGGVALRTHGDQVLVHPFIYRIVCRNGAIRGHATGTDSIARGRTDEDSWRLEAKIDAIREAIRACAAPDRFQEGLLEMRASARTRDIDQILLVAHLLPHLRGDAFHHPILAELLGTPGGDNRTLFDWMNRITAAGREARSPEERWWLEELGGSVGALLKPRRKSPSEGCSMLYSAP